MNASEGSGRASFHHDPSSTGSNFSVRLETHCVFGMGLHSAARV
jgi:hypothetical protein